MDGLRAYAFTDLLKGTPAAERIACAEAQDEAADIAEALAWANARAARNASPGQRRNPERAALPPCNRHARESDFEHAVPFEKGGRTCTCNAGACSRACHRVKQTKGWVVRQPRPGWHEWTTPAGRVYIQGPKRYPA
jgi:hypothetical protein